MWASDIAELFDVFFRHHSLKMKCGICKESKDAFKCDTCEIVGCKACMSLSASEVKVLQLNSRVLRFYCINCNKVQTCSLLQEIIKTKEELMESKNKLIEDKEEIISAKEEIINLLRAEIAELKKLKIPIDSCKVGYSEAVKRSKTEVLIVKPKKTNQESAVTKQVIEERISPSTLGVGISKMKFTREGGVAIGCRGDKDVQSVSKTVREELGEEYEVKIPIKKNPKIKIFNVEKRALADKEDFIEKVVMQNVITTDIKQRVLKVVDQYEDKKGRTNVIIELDPFTHGMVVKKRVLYIGWKTCRFVDHVNIIQCYQCWRFGHVAKECRKKDSVCPKCAGEHKYDACISAEEACVNCKYASEVLKIPGIDYVHRAFDRKCEAYRRVYRQLEQRINYLEVENIDSQ